ncbi:hypothetical protein LS68_008980 [Helicobacter sp. MIT 05-5293]|uniref:Eco57I restriction-modification methylase domain-containing protein n=1 Tax=Helicobacter sp. MIT 05-5293 TaxID=1548149 RepID=UPI0010FE4EF2|nr:Eco57I restriction-modification methylase domain-containing protein [Helicobacter sp. MIT 05-5293]TLD79962.1 hypothetical protein LS68_008980 [Helicobacter sp. MIT 05-5293]
MDVWRQSGEKRCWGGGALNDESSQGWDIVLGNPPYGADMGDKKQIYKGIYKYTISGALDSYKFFVELGYNLLGLGVLSFITPISITSSKSNANLHKLLLSQCEQIKVSSYGNSPARIFLNADQRVSIITFTKTFSPCKNLLTTQVNLRDKNTPIQSIIDNLCFINSLDFVKEGAFAKIGLKTEKDILHKLYTHKCTFKELMQGEEKVYYRSTGGRYYDLYTSYSTTSSTTQKSFFATESQVLVAIMSSTLFWWYRNLYSEGRHSYIYEFESFPIPYFGNTIIESLRDLGERYEGDLEANAEYRNGVKTYIIRKSKPIIDEIDSILCPLYGLSEEERDFIINFQVKFRTDT